jgi:hypothetical protein
VKREENAFPLSALGTAMDTDVITDYIAGILIFVTARS